jgi:hypothetical protein
VGCLGAEDSKGKLMKLSSAVKVAVAVYRANPFRPHCNGATGKHVWLCGVTAFMRGGRQDCPENG